MTQPHDIGQEIGQEIDQEIGQEIGQERHIGNPLRFSDLQPRPAGRAPLLGEHTEDVLRRWLDLDEAALRAAIDQGTCR